ncbi:MAG: hypothetical protein ACRAVC_19745 [Trichormus sp.]
MKIAIMKLDDVTIHEQLYLFRSLGDNGETPVMLLGRTSPR